MTRLKQNYFLLFLFFNSLKGYVPLYTGLEPVSLRKAGLFYIQKLDYVQQKKQFV